MIDAVREAFFAPFYFVAVVLAFALGCGAVYVIASFVVMIFDALVDKLNRRP